MQIGVMDNSVLDQPTPTWYAGKGFGFLPQSMKFLKPFGITVQLGYSFPTEFFYDYI